MISDACKIFNKCWDPQYDEWAPNYEKDLALMEYRAQEDLVQALVQYFRATPAQTLAQTRILDVACGSGLVAKKLSEYKFCHFVGVDASAGMLREAKQTGLYQELHQVFVGTDPMPVDNDSFDVVTVVGGMYPGFIPVKAVREFYSAAKPGGLVCMSRGIFPRPEYVTYDNELEAELTLMEAELLWTRLSETKVQRYVVDSHQEDDSKPRKYIPGTVYFFKKN